MIKIDWRNHAKSIPINRLTYFAAPPCEAAGRQDGKTPPSHVSSLPTSNSSNALYLDPGLARNGTNGTGKYDGGWHTDTLILQTYKTCYRQLNVHTRKVPPRTTHKHHHPPPAIESSLSVLLPHTVIYSFRSTSHSA